MDEMNEIINDNNDNNILNADNTDNTVTAVTDTSYQNDDTANEDRYSNYIDNSVSVNENRYHSDYQSSEEASTPAAEVIKSQKPYGNYYNNAYMGEPVVKEKKKRHVPTAIRILLSAVLFGVIAAGVFIGTNELYYTLYPSAAPVAESSVLHIGSTTTSNSTDRTTVASTSVVTNVSASSTDVSAVVENAMPSIVSIDCTFNTQSFFGTYETSGAGSGIILKQTDTELLIATNNHVVANATSINVTFCDDSTASAVTKGTDSTADLAVIAIDLSELSSDTLKAIKVATLGSSDDIRVGQMVVAIGNALGYGQSTTVGYVSAKDREVTVDGTNMTLLQTDAAINPGNSGGALLNLNGEVIGINSVKYSDSSVEGMGFAIPISRAQAILNELANREILKDNEKGYLGVYIQDITSSISEVYNMPIGVYIADFAEGSPAETAGIQVGDIVTAVNGTSVSTSTDLKNAVTSYRAGTTITLTFERRIDGTYTEMSLDVTLIANPDYSK